MVLDAHAHLTRQGWKGKGHAVREGHLSRPLAVKVKNNLNGLGKDRDDAFPFWDHVFSAVASSIVIPTSSSSNPSASSSSASPEPSSSSSLNTQLPGSAVFHRTTTGIISPYASQQSTSSSSSSTTNNTTATAANTLSFGAGSALNLTAMSAAKREAAKRGLYAQFMKGRIIPSSLPVEEDVGAGRKGKGREVVLGDQLKITPPSSSTKHNCDAPSTSTSSTPVGFLLSAPSLPLFPPSKKRRSSSSSPFDTAVESKKRKKPQKETEGKEGKEARRERKRVEKMAKEARGVLKAARKAAKIARKKNVDGVDV